MRSKAALSGRSTVEGIDPEEGFPPSGASVGCWRRGPSGPHDDSNTRIFELEELPTREVEKEAPPAPAKTTPGGTFVTLREDDVWLTAFTPGGTFVPDNREDEAAGIKVDPVFRSDPERACSGTPTPGGTFVTDNREYGASPTTLTP